jgi:hypothetical protein
MENLKFSADVECSADGRAARQCKYCKKHKAPVKMSSYYICRVCANSAEEKGQAKLRKAWRAERELRVDTKTISLCQSWANLANTMLIQQNAQGLTL